MVWQRRQVATLATQVRRSSLRFQHEAAALEVLLVLAFFIIPIASEFGPGKEILGPPIQNTLLPEQPPL